MMTRTLSLAVVLVALAVLAVPSGWLAVDAMTITSAPVQQEGQTVYDIRISDNTNARRRLAIPAFSVAAGAPADVQAAAKTISDVLWQDIEFEREFYVLPQADAARVPPATSVETLPYDRWAELGVDYVVLGRVAPDAAGLSVEVEIVGTRGDHLRRRVFGKRYGGGGCNIKNPRFCAHYIADEFHKVQGVDGIARTRLAFASDRSTEEVPGRTATNPAKEIYISDYDGANVYRVTVNRNLSIMPSWSPDGRLLAYTSFATGFNDIYIQSVYEYTGRPARPAGGSESIKNSSPAWSPDGTRLAFASVRDGGEQEVFIVNRDGSNVRQLTNHARSSFAPAWSPSGTQLVIVSDRAGDPQLYLIGADGTGLANLPCGPWRCDHPSWSAVTNKIAYTCGTEAAGWDVCVIDMATRQIANLTDGLPGSYEQPTFAPNGRHIVFNTNRWGKKQLAMIDISGKMHERRVTNAGNNEYPAWSRSAQ